MDKIHIIEKLFSYLLLYSYLLLPLFFIFSRAKKSTIVVALLIYGVVFYLFLKFFFIIPITYRQLEQAVYTYLEYSFFSFFLFINLKKKLNRKIIILFSILFLCFQVVYYFVSSFQRIDSVPVGIETILVLVFIFLYFQEYFNTNNTTYIYSDPAFWVVVGVLIYLSSSFFFNILANHLPRDNWYLTFIPEIIKNILFSISIVLFKPKTNAVNSSNVPYLDLI